MIQISLTQGKVATIDDADYPLVSQYQWHVQKATKCWYATTWATVNGKRRMLYLHRVIMGITDTAVQVDHIDFDGLNNRRSNLRQATSAENNRNKRKQADTTSTYKGVCWDQQREQWMAKIMVNQKRINLGRFSSELEAAAAYDHAAVIHHGVFASPNFTLNVAA